jgi:TATA-box binding protein (TBP) (component of TFIID and TFIIIB)
MSGESEDVKTLLHLVSTKEPLGIPRTRFRDYLGETLNKTPRQVNEMIAKYKQDYFEPRQEYLESIDLKISPLSTGLYNAVVSTGSPIDIRSILTKVKQVKLVEEGDFKVTQFTVRYGRFKTAVKFNSEYGLSGDESKRFVSADFQVKVTRGQETKGASFSFYKSGKIRFSGSYSNDEAPRKLLKFFSKHYFTITNVATIPITLNNVTAEFRVGFPLKTSLIHDVFSEKDLSYFKRDYKVLAKYESKKSKFLYISFTKGTTKFSIIIADSGVIQIQGTSEVQAAYRLMKEFFEALKDNDFMIITKNSSQSNRMVKPKNTKVSRRFDNLPAPNVTRRGTTCPVDRRPNPYSYAGTCPKQGCYIKPNPQGQPCCYSVPKSLEYSKNKVANAYNKAGIRVPNGVRTLFGFGRNTNNKPVNVSNKKPEVRTYVNNKSGFKIDSRQCLRYTKVALVDMARRLRIELPAKLTKPILCGLIKDASNLPNVAVKTGSKVISGANKNLRLGGRVCSTYTIATLTRFARAMGGVVSPDMRKEDICKLIQQLSNARRTKLQANFNRNKVIRNKAEANRLQALENQRLRNEANKKKKEAEAKKEKRVKKAKDANTARLSRNAVREDLMVMTNGDATNKNVDDLMTALAQALNSGKIKRTKASVDKFKLAFGQQVVNRLNAE